MAMLQEDAVRSAGIYLDYLLAHRNEGAGIVRVRVRSIQGSLLDGEMVLTCERELRMVDEIALRVGGKLYENSNDQILFRVCGYSKKTLSIVPCPALAEHLEQALAEKTPVFLESDLTFLVQRIKKWYEAYGDLVALPRGSGRGTVGLSGENPIPLSDNQYEAADVAMSSPLSYIWGAPGTGKTKHVLASCVWSLIRAGKKVILCAPTNNALEQSLSGLLSALTSDGQYEPGGRVLRMGVPGDGFRMAWGEVCEDGAVDWWKRELGEKVSWLQYQNALVDKTVIIRAGEGEDGEVDPFPGKSDRDLTKYKKENKAEINRLQQKSKLLSDSRNIMPMISEFDLVAATVDTCLYRLAPDGDFQASHVFLDEAGYCSVIKAMALTGYGLPLTMLGDHMQLPPVFENEEEVTRLPDAGVTRLWKISGLYLEDVVTCDELNAFCAAVPLRPRFEETAVAALTETFRFGPALAGVLARRVYGERFHSGSDNETRIWFMDAPKTEEDKTRNELGRHRRISHAEAKCIRELIEANLYHGWLSVGVIAPYVNQRNLLSESIHRLMKKHGLTEDMDDDVVTVHGSQGREWDVVIFSVTDSFEEAFLTNSRRPESLKLLNTAVSRARKTLILVGDVANWKRRPGQLLSELIGIAMPAEKDFGTEW